MKQMILTTCFTLACSIALLGATPQDSQSGNQSGSQTTSSSKHSRSTTSSTESRANKGSMTVTGCLQAGTEPNTFTLNNVSEGASQTSSTSSQNQNPSEMARAETSYVLVPSSSKMDLSKHIGHRVEVTGTIVSGSAGKGMHSSSSAPDSSTSSSSSTSEQSGTNGSMADMNAQHLKVHRIRQISTSCP